MTETKPHRLYLRAAIKIMTLCLLLLISGVFVHGMLNPVSNGSALTRVSLTELTDHQAQQIHWQDQPYLLIKRAPQRLTSTRHSNMLHDPYSDHSQQPEMAKNAYRSLRKDYLIVTALSATGCKLQFQPKLGFSDPCSGARFDLAGRSLRSAPAHANLYVPPHIVQGQWLFLGREKF